MDNYIQDPFYVSNALFNHVIPHHRKSFSEKQEVYDEMGLSR